MTEMAKEEMAAPKAAGENIGESAAAAANRN